MLLNYGSVLNYVQFFHDFLQFGFHGVRTGILVIACSQRRCSGSFSMNVFDVCNEKTSRTSPLRTGDYKYPCPDSVKPKLEKIMKKLGVI